LFRKKSAAKVSDVLDKMLAPGDGGDAKGAHPPAGNAPARGEARPGADGLNQLFNDLGPKGRGKPGAQPAPYDAPAPEGSSFWDGPPDTSANTDRFLDLEELYHSFNMRSSGVDTVYLMESYIKILPETLPTELRRSIITQIMEASGFDFNAILNDGVDRVSKLTDYAATFVARTDALLERYNAEIDALERQVKNLRDLIAERKDLHKRQSLAIEGEARRLKDILDFISK